MVGRGWWLVVEGWSLLLLVGGGMVLVMLRWDVRMRAYDPTKFLALKRRKTCLKRATPISSVWSHCIGPF